MKRRIETLCVVAAAALVTAPAAVGLQLLVPGYWSEEFTSFAVRPEEGAISGMVFGPEGNLYISVQARLDPLPGRGRVLKISPEGLVTEFASGLPNICTHMIWAGGSSFGDHFFLNCVTLSPSGGDSIVKLGLDGGWSKFAPFEPPRHCPSFLTLDPAGGYGGLLYAGTNCQDRVYRIYPDGGVALFSNWPNWVDGGGPYGADFDRMGHYGGALFITSDFSGGTREDVSGIFRMDTNGAVTRFVDGIAKAWRVVFDPHGVMFGGEMFALGAEQFRDPVDRQRLWRVSPAGEAVAFLRPTTGSGISFVFGPDGSLFVTESVDLTTVVVHRVFAPRTARELAILELDQAIAEKLESLDRIGEAWKRERRAIRALNEMLVTGELDGLRRKDVLWAWARIRVAMVLQRISAQRLTMSLRALAAARELLDP